MADRRSAGHRAAGWLALLLFLIFAGNVVLFKAASLLSFTAPRFSALLEFLLLGIATFFGVLFLIGEETRKSPPDQK